MIRNLVLGLLLFAAGLLIGLPATQSQPALPPLPGFGPQAGRFAVARVTDGGAIFLLDTATGDLFLADIKDVKPYSERPKINVNMGGLPVPPKDGLPPLPRDLKDSK